MLRFLISLILLCIGSRAFSQTIPDSLILEKLAVVKLDKAALKLDSLLNERDSRSHRRVDTLYLQRLPQRFRVKLMLNASGTSIIAKGINDNGTFRADLSAKNKYTVSVGFSYRGLSASLAVNPAHLAGKKNDYEFNMNAYSNKFGADLIYRYAKTFKGKVTSNDNVGDVPEGLVKQKQLNVNLYYVFNSRRFSYPAAFSQSWLQKRSRGSFMIGTSFTLGQMKVDGNDVLWNKSLLLNYANIGVGAGYAYNLVLRKGWLIHLSSLPEVVVFNRSKMKEDDNKVRAPYRFPNIIAVGRVAVVKHFKRYYTGASAVINGSTMGDKDKLLFANVSWRVRMFVGLKM